MKASLRIEAIGHDTVARMRLMGSVFEEAGAGDIASVVFGDPLDYARWGVVEVDDNGAVVGRPNGRTDYSNANSKGSRGVYIWYVLESGRRYFVCAPESWRAVDEYYCRVSDNGEIIRE